jgi:hypothetical protein
VNFFFKHRDTGAFREDFKVVVATPTQDTPHTDFYIKVYLLQHHKIFKVKLLAVCDFLSDLQKTVLLSFMCKNYAVATKEKVTVNARYLSFCEAVGDDPTTRTEAQEQERQQMIAENPDLFVCAFIYSDADK